MYISPLKALGVDVTKNLELPLRGIAQQCEAMGLPVPDVEVAMRSGDSTPEQRRKIVSHPPDILVTTPESLFLLLTSKASSILAGVETVIVDEVHAVAGSKRGAHLALSLERLDDMIGHPVQRIGLSATVNPVEEVARFLGGSQPVTVVNPGAVPAMDLRAVEPLRNMLDTSATGEFRYRRLLNGPFSMRCCGTEPHWCSSTRVDWQRSLLHRLEQTCMRSRNRARRRPI